MTDHDYPEENHPVDAEGLDTHWTPSQAEGDRDTVEHDLEEKEGNERRPEQAQLPDGIGGDPLSTPSQAEGDRDTIDRDLDEKLGS